MSTSASDDVILNLDSVNLVFHADVYRSWTWRDAFTRLASSPGSALVPAADRLHVAKDVSFSVRRGERVGLIGHNGAGKTSLCRCIAGMYQPTSGRLETYGSVRAVFDTGLGIQPELTGRENAELLMELMFPGDPARREMVDEALEFSGLGRFVDMPFRVYSNGMQARLCLSVVSCRPSELLILDEVFDGADASFREKVSARVHRMIRDSGAVIFVSHSEAHVRDVCSRVLVLDHGVVSFDGPVAAGLEHYRKLVSRESRKK